MDVADLKQNRPDTDLYMGGPEQIYPLGRGDVLIRMYSSDPAEYLTLTRNVGGKAKLLWKAELVARPKGRGLPTGTLARYLADMDLALSPDAPREAQNQVRAVVAGYAACHIQGGICNLQCWVVKADGATTALEESDSTDLDKTGYPVTRAERALLTRRSGRQSLHSGRPGRRDSIQGGNG